MYQGFKHFAGKTLLFCLSTLTLTTRAFTPTPEMLNAFNNLTPAQQQQLLDKYQQGGVDSFLKVETSTDINNDGAKAGQPLEPRRVDNTKISQRPEPMLKDMKQRESLPYFGYNVFSGRDVNFTAVDNMPVPDTYTIGPGDVLNIQLYGKENKSIKLSVRRNGAIEFPGLGPIQVSGYQFAQLEVELAKRIKNQITGVEVVVSIDKLRTIQVYVTGDAYQPGAYNMNALTTVTQALVAAGGIDTVGSLRNIQVKRHGKLVQAIDLYDVLISGDNTADIRLRSGDTIFIPAKGGEFTVKGSIKRPAVYELKDKPSVRDVLHIAGGIRADGLSSKLRINRKTSKGVQVFTVAATGDEQDNFKIHDGDEIIIDPKNPSVNAAVFLHGAVVRPGNYNFDPGMRVSDIISDIDSDLIKQTDLGYALVVREINPEHDLKVIQFNLKDAIENPDGPNNITLAVKDEVLVFSNYIEGNDGADNKANDSSQAENNPIKEAPQLDEQQMMHKSRLTLASLRDFNQNMIDVGLQYDELAGNQVRDTDTKEDYNERVKASSRQKLLGALNERLKRQARYGSPVQLVEVSGAVQYPGVYPLAENSRLQALVSAAGGVLESVYPNEVELSRYQDASAGNKLIHKNIAVDFTDQSVDAAWNIQLASKDRVNLRVNESWRKDYNVEVLGEVQFPGTYTIAKGEMLSDVVKRAGGLSQYANPRGAVFTRVSVKEQEQLRSEQFAKQLQQDISLLALRRQSGGSSYTSSPSEAVNLVNNLQQMEPTGRVIIKLPEILEGRESVDLMLEDGDKIYIPPFRKLIAIMGQVQAENTYIYEKGLSVQDYIQLAGGTKKQADTKRIYVIRANGAMMVPEHSYWFKRNRGQLEAGDTIVVPVDTDYIDTLSLWSTATNMITNTAVTWGTINSIVNK